MSSAESLLHRWSDLPEASPIPEGAVAECGFVFPGQDKAVRTGYPQRCSECFSEEESERCGVYRYSPLGRAAPEGPWGPGVLNANRCVAPAEAGGFCKAHEAALEEEWGVPPIPPTRDR